MHLKPFVLAITAITLGAGTVARAQQGGGRPIAVDQFLSLDRVAEPAVSPDGRWTAYTLITTDLAANRRRQDLWLHAIDGGAARRISTDSLGGRGAKWSPDGRTLAFISSRGGTPQIWLFDVASGATRQLTFLSTGADGVIWAPAGRRLAFVSEVYPDCRDDACNRRRAAADAERPSQARVYDELLFRHWTTWEDGLRSHLFVVPADGGPPRDLLAGKDYDTPVPPFGGSVDYAFSPDGSEIAFTTKIGSDQAWHTNNDIYVVPVTGGEPVNLTAGLMGAQQTPAYSADGRFIAFLSQERAGFESDRWQLMIKDRRSGAVRELPKGLDRPVLEYAWAGAGNDCYAIIEDRQRHVLLHITDAGDVHRIVTNLNPAQLSLAATPSGPVVGFVSDAVHQPGQVYTLSAAHGNTPRQLTRVNDDKLRGVTMHPAEAVKWAGADGDTIYGMVVKPPQFREGRRYPLLVLVHGGPQGAWLDNFGSRWNAEVFAAPGYVVFMPNPRGSTGFGQRFLDQISRDWGGRVFTDLMRGVDLAAQLPYVDSTRMAAAGGSYGGYMVNWVNGHTNRFDALVSHAGVYNLESMYGATEELWFTDWEFGGPYWTNRVDYDKWSPHRFAENFRTPTLVIHGALDYRVPDTEGMQMFTALRRQGVPSRFLYFPDEGHWIGRPQNQRVWWTTIHEWLGRYLSPSATP